MFTYVYPEAQQNEPSRISKHNALPLREETENQGPLSVTIMITVACWTIAESDFGRLAGGLQKTFFCINYARITDCCLRAVVVIVLVVHSCTR